LIQGPAPDKTAVGIRADPNDVQEVQLRFSEDAITGGNHIYVTRGSADNMRVYEDAEKIVGILGGEALTAQVPDEAYSDAGSGSVWVDWFGPGGPLESETISFQVRDSDGDPISATETVTFKPFLGVIVAIAGFGNVPGSTTDGGTVIAQKLYENGYDVLTYPYSGVSAAFADVKDHVVHSAVSDIAILGHSYGGGATFELANELNEDADIQTQRSLGGGFLTFTAYRI
jgi:hypothetical protein